MAQPPITIGPMQAGHLPAVAALETELFEHSWSLSSLEQELSNPGACWLVAQTAGEVVGYVGMYHVLDEGFIYNVAINENYRRRGVASQLLEALLYRCKGNKLATVTLEVRASNAAAIGLYHKFLFRQVGVRKGYYTTPKEDALLLTCFFNRRR